MAAPFSNHKISVCLVSIHPLVLRELRRQLGNAPNLRLAPRRLGQDPAEDSFDPLPRASIYVIDREGYSGSLEALSLEILHTHPRARIVVIAEDFSEANAFPLLRSGVKGLIRHEDVGKQLRRALQAVSSGGFWVPRSLLSKFVESIISNSKLAASPSIPKRLSRRERDVIEGVLQNLSNKEIANKLNITERTVKFHVSNLLAKYSVRRRSDLLLLHFQSSPPDSANSQIRSADSGSGPIIM